MNRPPRPQINFELDSALDYRNTAISGYGLEGRKIGQALIRADWILEMVKWRLDLDKGIAQKEDFPHTPGSSPHKPNIPSRRGIPSAGRQSAFMKRMRASAVRSIGASGGAGARPKINA